MSIRKVGKSLVYSKSLRTGEGVFFFIVVLIYIIMSFCVIEGVVAVNCCSFFLF